MGAEADPVDDPRPWAAHDAQLSRPAGLLGHRRRSGLAVQGHHVAIPQQAEYGRVRADGPAVDPQLHLAGRPGMPVAPVQVVRRAGVREPYDVGRAGGPAVERGGEGGDRGAPVAFDQHVAAAVLADHGERYPHARTPRRRLCGGLAESVSSRGVPVKISWRTGHAARGVTVAVSPPLIGAFPRNG